MPEVKTLLTVARVRPEQWEILKTLRLAALKEAPYAFGTTYASAVQRPDAEWQEMAWQRATSSDSCMYFVYQDGEPVGMAGGYRDTEHPDFVQLTSVWVVPQHRKAGAGQAVVEAVCDWAASLPVASIKADVTASNTQVLHFYQRIGFQPVATPASATAPHEEDVLIARSLIP